MQSTHSFRRLAVAALAVAAAAITPSLAATASVITWRMTPTGADLNATGKIVYKIQPGKDMFNLTVHGLTQGLYDFTVNGNVVDTIQVNDENNGNTNGKLRLKTKKGTLSFDPRGAVLAVSQAGTDFLVTNFPVCDNEGEEFDVETDFTDLGVVPGASGHVEMRAEDGVRTFEIDVANLPQGTYDVVVDGSISGSLAIDSTGAGEIQFSTKVKDK